MEKKVYYEMFTSAGERACQSLVNSISKKILGPRRITKEHIAELFESGRKKISEKHGEVYDTEPRWNIARQINLALEKAGYAFELNAWGDVVDK